MADYLRTGLARNFEVRDIIGLGRTQLGLFIQLMLALQHCRQDPFSYRPEVFVGYNETPTLSLWSNNYGRQLFLPPINIQVAFSNFGFGTITGNVCFADSSQLPQNIGLLPVDYVRLINAPTWADTDTIVQVLNAWNAFNEATGINYKFDSELYSEILEA